MASSGHRRKRDCTSLSSSNLCGACGKSFSASHILAKHQRKCQDTARELEELRSRAIQLQESVKRRRLDAAGAFESIREPQAHLSRTLAAEGQPHETSPQDQLVQHNEDIRSNEGTDSQSFPEPRPADATQAEARIPVGASQKAGPLRYSHSTMDSFGLKKHYYSDKLPVHDPDMKQTKHDLYDSPYHMHQPADDFEAQANASGDSETPSFGPFPNLSSFELGEWFYGQGVQKSLKDFKALIQLLTSPGFSISDIQNTKWKKVFQDLGKNKEELKPSESEWIDDSGWKTTDIEIEVPIHHRMGSGKGVEKHVAGKLFHRSIVSIVEEKMKNASDSRFFHHDGHELLWSPDKSDNSPEIRVLSEFYHSDAFLQAQNEVRDSPPPQIKGCDLPRVLLGLMFWSDATHLSTFSTSKLWPLYMLFANESKHRRGADLCNHVAYFDVLPDSFKDYVTGRTGGKVPPNGFTAHLNRELFHAQWAILLDDELLKAIEEGIVITCRDGIQRRFFIRIFTYSADYPEKVLIATIKNRGDCPCVRCLVQKKNLSQMGTPEDMTFRANHPRVDDAERQDRVEKARGVIQGGAAVNGKPVMRELKNAEVPTVNAFSKRLRALGFDIFSALVVDLLHDYEIGVWKALFIHLIRVLEASSTGSVLVNELDKRYRAMPVFNQTIRKFSSNVSELKRRAARDYEDLLQCSIPAFDGLLPEPLNGIVLKLLFVNARWHAVAKLRMQTEPTLVILEQATTLLGEQYRSFIEETANIKTLELPKEAERRMKAASKKSSKAKSSPSFRIVQAAKSSSSVPILSERGVAIESNVAQVQHPPNVRGNKTTRRAKKLNISTIKFHVIGHYPKVIRYFGPSDLFSTEWGEHWHGKSKGWSKRTSRKFIRKEISQHERRQARVKRIRRRILSNAKSEEARELREQQEAARNPDIHHHIGQSRQKAILCTKFFQNGSLSTDVACSSFIRNLKQHLLPRFFAAAEPNLDAQQLSEGIQAQEWANIILKDNRFYSHKIMRIKYTAYNTRRDEDIIHLDTDRCNVMLVNPEYTRGSSLHPFFYAKVIGILHAEVGYVGSVGGFTGSYKYHTIEFLWVRWFRVCPSTDMELDKAELLPLSNPESQGFIDPNQVLRACHMIPCFKSGKRYPDGKGTSELAQDGTDWNEYFINRYAIW
ncbi:hypothetical protein H1R20_g16181, partial [Candolleomyces eurysporus]